MHRRTFMVCLPVAHVFGSCGLTWPVSAQDARRLLTRGVFKAARTAAKIDEWCGWIDDSVVAMQRQQIPPDLPENFSGPLLRQNFEELLRDAQSLGAPDFTPISIPTSDRLPCTPDGRRQILQLATMEWQKGCDEFAATIAAIEEIRELRLQAEARTNLLTQIADRYQAIILVTPPSTIRNLLGFEFLEYDTILRPLNGRIVVALREAEGRQNRAMAGRAGEVQQGAQGLQALLAVELSWLKNDADELTREFEALAGRRRELDGRTRTLQQHQAELARIDRQLATLRREIEALQGAILQDRSILSRLDSAVGPLEAQMNAPYTDCPNRNSFERCNHPELKNAYLARRDAARVNLDQTLRDIESVRATMQSMMQRKAQFEATLERTLIARPAQVAAIEQMAAGLENERRTLDADTEKLERKKWQSRANKLADQNRQNSTAVAACIARLPPLR